MGNTPRKKPTSGVRGPSGALRAGGSPTRPTGATPSARRRLERISAPILVTLSRTPKWLLVIAMALLLFFGMIQSGSLAWLGALLLGILTVFFGWLLAVAWPVLPTSGRLLRGVVVIALAGLTVLKALGRV